MKQKNKKKLNNEPCYNYKRWVLKYQPKQTSQKKQIKRQQLLKNLNMKEYAKINKFKMTEVILIIE